MLAELVGLFFAELIVDVGEDDAGAFVNECLGNAQPDALGGSGDEGDFVFQAGHIHKSFVVWAFIGVIGVTESRLICILDPCLLIPKHLPINPSTRLYNGYGDMTS